MTKNEVVFLAIIRTINDKEQTNQKMVTVNEDNMQTAFLEQVQAILDEFVDIFPKDLPGGLPPSRELDHWIELVPRLEPPHRAPYRMSPQGLDELKKQLKCNNAE